VLQKTTRRPMVEQLIQSIGPAALAVAIIWRWLQATREEKDLWQTRYIELVTKMREEAMADRQAYEQMISNDIETPS